jgi:hypothetical protein
VKKSPTKIKENGVSSWLALCDSQQQQSVLQADVGVRYAQEVLSNFLNKKMIVPKFGLSHPLLSWVMEIDQCIKDHHFDFIHGRTSSNVSLPSDQFAVLHQAYRRTLHPGFLTGPNRSSSSLQTIRSLLNDVESSSRGSVSPTVDHNDHRHDHTNNIMYRDRTCNLFEFMSLNAQYNGISHLVLEYIGDYNQIFPFLLTMMENQCLYGVSQSVHYANAFNFEGMPSVDMLNYIISKFNHHQNLPTINHQLLQTIPIRFVVCALARIFYEEKLCGICLDKTNRYTRYRGVCTIWEQGIVCWECALSVPNLFVVSTDQKKILVQELVKKHPHLTEDYVNLKISRLLRTVVLRNVVGASFKKIRYYNAEYLHSLLTQIVRKPYPAIENSWWSQYVNHHVVSTNHGLDEIPSNMMKRKLIHEVKTPTFSPNKRQKSITDFSHLTISEHDNHNSSLMNIKIAKQRLQALDREQHLLTYLSLYCQRLQEKCAAESQPYVDLVSANKYGNCIYCDMEFDPKEESIICKPLSSIIPTHKWHSMCWEDFQSEFEMDECHFCQSLL